MNTVIKSFFSVFVLTLLVAGLFSAPEIAHSSQDSTFSFQVDHDHSATHSDASGCDDESQVCHKCHLGHCAFTLRFVSVRYLTADKNIVYDRYSCVLPSSVTTSLYRPPIS